MIYLDNSSTTRQYDEVTDLIYDISKNNFGNPSSLHSLGFDAYNYITAAREEIESKFYGNGSVIFTSGGTEADNLALFSISHKHKRDGNKIITTCIEHPAVIESCRRLENEGFEVVYLNVDVDGSIELGELKKELDDNVILVSIMTVNNEVGTIEPVIPAYNAVKEYNRNHGTNIIFHTDAVQAFGKIRFEDSPFDLISISGHKIHGPKGTGALYANKNIKMPAYIVGGGQENGFRSGTENVPGIAGLGLSTKMSYEDFDNKQQKMTAVNDYFRRGIQDSIKDTILNGYEQTGFGLFDYGKRCPSILNISFLGTRGEVLLHTLEQDGIFVSTGSACASNSNGDSHVLKAMLMDHKEIEGTIRFSFSEFNTIDDMDFVLDRLIKAVNRFRKLGTYR